MPRCLQSVDDAVEPWELGTGTGVAVGAGLMGGTIRWLRGEMLVGVGRSVEEPGNVETDLLRWQSVDGP